MRQSWTVAKDRRRLWRCYLQAIASRCLAGSCLTASVYVSTGLTQTLPEVPSFWLSNLTWHVARAVQHPDKGKCPAREGTALVQFIINRGGRVLDARIAQGSGFQDLDLEAVNAVKRASPFPLPPELISPLRLTFDIPVTFRGCRK